MFCFVFENILLDKILHNNEASSNLTQSTIRSGSIDDRDQDRASIGCNLFYLYLINIIKWSSSVLALDFRTAVKTVRKNFPVSSYSSSDDDDDFYDADETME